MALPAHEEWTTGLADEPAGTWRKSSRSYANGGCIEVAFLSSELIGVRDSKNPRGTVLRFTHAEWDAFVDNVRNGEGLFVIAAPLGSRPVAGFPSMGPSHRSGGVARG
jgi:Domain of unknown function (DUF397)